MTKKKQSLLDEEFEKTWFIYYTLAYNYYNANGNLEIPITFKTSNGVSFDENGYALGKWISLNLKKYKFLDEDMKEKLHSIGFISGAAESKWLHNFQLARKYYEHHGDLKILTNFKTRDGINPDERGEALGSWIVKQRNNHFSKNLKERTFLELEHEVLLESIGMIWDVNQNKTMVKKICARYHIDYYKYCEILGNMQYQELVARIECLKEHNIKIVNKDDSINGMLFMSIREFKRVFGVNLSTRIRQALTVTRNKEARSTKRI